MLFGAFKEKVVNLNGRWVPSYDILHIIVGPLTDRYSKRKILI